MLKLFAFGAGAAIGIVILGAAINIGFQIGAWKLEGLGE
jgi:F0F1-type ATP synthase membrane subunit c/vacuolar-type H+-ATPase subunit K